MNTLLIFFALPIAIIIISIALQKIFKCPFLVAGIIFAIFLIVTFAIGNLNYLVATIAYTILAFITAILTNIICRILRELDRREEANNNSGNLLTISSNGCNGVENDLLTINASYPNNNSNNTGSCSCNTSNDSIAVRAKVIPNNNTNGRTGSFCGCFRRR
ncbi:unknown [Clostridium sp. CAG:470]|jgi:K+-sensing histidine kinase KdpD|nr:MAG: hypothetical protein BHW03_05690 [Clostridium sp. 28_17]CDE14572.1 unknown [Clostridium sp. CAG:470]